MSQSCWQRGHVFIDAEKHHRAHRCEKTYLCAVGPVTAMRTLYRARPGERAVAAMERKAGIVEGYWTPHAARQGAILTAHLVPREAEEVLGVLGNMTPSKSSLDRLPKALSARWVAQRPQFEARVREDTLEVADTACTVAVSLDGVMAPMKTGGGGYREASCASVSLYDGEGERLSTVRMARMPESKKVTLKTMVGAEVEAVLGQRPDLQLVKIADGANDNWTFPASCITFLSEQAFAPQNTRFWSRRRVWFQFTVGEDKPPMLSVDNRGKGVLSMDCSAKRSPL